jgi:hypothetical protein
MQTLEIKHIVILRFHTRTSWKIQVNSKSIASALFRIPDVQTISGLVPLNDSRLQLAN